MHMGIVLSYNIVLNIVSVLDVAYVNLAIDSGGYVYEHPSRINCSILLNASQIS